MSNKIAKKKQNAVDPAIEIMRQLMEFAVTFLLFALCIVVPFYAKDGYNRIGDAKFAAYRAVMIPGLVVLFFMVLFYALFWIMQNRRCHISATDCFVTAYLVLTGIAVVSGGFYQDAFWGSTGWNMGFFSQVSFVLLYLFLSRFGKYYNQILAVLCVSALGVFVLGILHRLLIDPIGFYDGLADYQKAQFLSTLGQATWYASFLVVVLPIGIAVFLYAASRRWTILSGIFTFIGFCTLVTQNSDSAYFAVLGFFLVFLWDAVQKKDVLLRYLLVLILFLAAGKIMYFMLQINPNPALELDFVTDLILSSAVTWGLLILCIGFYAALFLAGKRNRYPRRSMVWVRNILYGMTAVGILAVVFLIVLKGSGVLPERLAEQLSGISYMNWGSEWGNGRGRIWTFSVKVFMEESIGHKLFGVGPDCFNSYIAANHSEEAQLLWGDMLLTNAHNEWLNIFINAGLIGGAAYLGIFVSAIRRFMKRYEHNFLLIGIAACIVSYMAYNFFCYQQVLCTPFIFILIGIGEYIARETVS